MVGPKPRIGLSTGLLTLVQLCRKHAEEEGLVFVERDAYLDVPDPDALAIEFLSRSVEFSEPLIDADDGLRGFELKDADGYVLFFGCPRS